MFLSVLPGLIFLSGVMVNSTHGWEKIADGLAVTACAALGVRIARMGIFAGPDRLIVRGYFRTYRIPWAEVAGFEVPPPYGTWRKAGLGVRLTGGRLVSASLYAHGPLDSGRAARTVVAALDQLRQQHTVGLHDDPAQPGQVHADHPDLDDAPS